MLPEIADFGAAEAPMGAGFSFGSGNEVREVSLHAGPGTGTCAGEAAETQQLIADELVIGRILERQKVFCAKGEGSRLPCDAGIQRAPRSHSFQGTMRTPRSQGTAVCVKSTWRQPSISATMARSSASSLFVATIFDFAKSSSSRPVMTSKAPGAVVFTGSPAQTSGSNP